MRRTRSLVLALCLASGGASARWYDAESGRFLSDDPVGVTPQKLLYPTGLSPWLYANGGPTRFVDPDGRDPFMSMLVVADKAGGGSDPAVVRCYSGHSASACQQSKAELIATEAAGAAEICLVVPGCPALAARGGLYGLLGDGVRQSVKQLEGGQQGFNSDEYFQSWVAGMALGPFSRVPGSAPVLMTVGTGVGLWSAKHEADNHNYLTALFDLTTSLYTPASVGGARLRKPQGTFLEFIGLTGSPSGLTPGGLETEVPNISPPEVTLPAPSVSMDVSAASIALKVGTYGGKPISASNPDYGSGKGRRGSVETRKDIDRVRDEFLDANPDYEHVAGGTDQFTGKKFPEEYLRPNGGRREGGAYSDLTFRHRATGERIRINTVDVEANGQMTPREASNFERIFELTREPIIATPKPKVP